MKRITATAALVLLVALAAPAAGQQPTPSPAVPPPPSPRPKTDQSVPVQKGMRLSVSNFAGSVTVRAWDKDAVRVQAEHSARDRVNVRTTEAVLRISVSSERGPSRIVDFTLTVPRWMPIGIQGTYLDVDLDGLQNEVTAETVGGDIRLKGGSGVVSLKSVEGVIEVDAAKGRMTLNTVNEAIHVRDASGEIVAETVNGDLTLERIESVSVDVATVNGDVIYDGSVRDGGTYRFATHNGDVELRVPDQINASVFVRTYRGDFESHFQVQVPTAPDIDRDERRRRNRRFNFTLGSGAARLELESFGGDISLFKRSQVRRPATKKHEHDLLQ
jgi:DUF4097 and DUF4098 domain-containing protein YvlB